MAGIFLLAALAPGSSNKKKAQKATTAAIRSCGYHAMAELLWPPEATAVLALSLFWLALCVCLCQ